MSIIQIVIWVFFSKTTQKLEVITKETKTDDHYLVATLFRVQTKIFKTKKKMSCPLVIYAAGIFKKTSTTIGSSREFSKNII